MAATMDTDGRRITWTSLAGLVISVYALWVESGGVGADDGGGRAMCDISERISCSKVFHSKYGRGFGIVGAVLGEGSWLNQANGVAGIVFYLLMIGLGFPAHRSGAVCQLILNIVANVLTVYLAYLLYFVLDALCVVCVSLYALNAVNMVWSYQRVFWAGREPGKKPD